MKNKITSQAVISTLLCFVPMLLALVFYDKLPDQMPIHFNAAGEVDNFASKAVACFALPGGLAVVNIIVHFALNADPKKDNAKGVVRAIGLWTIPIISIVVNAIVIFKALDYDLPIEVIIPLMMGVLFIIIGNYLPKCKQNYTVGIKVPWTLNSEENWNKTHRMAGVLWMLGGLVMVVMSFLQALMGAALIIVILALAVAPIVYSYFLYRKGI